MSAFVLDKDVCCNFMNRFSTLKVVKFSIRVMNNKVVVYIVCVLEGLDIFALFTVT